MKKPFIHYISNIVVSNDIANLILSMGARPIMAQNSEECEDITASCDSIVLNCGTPDDDKFKAILLSGKLANSKSIPVVFDPVGVGASRWRKRQIQTILENVKPDIMHCNYSEANALIQEQSDFQGVDSLKSQQHRRLETAKTLANKYHCVVVLSGEEDIITDGLEVRIVSGGSEKMADITGTGCMLSAIIGVYCSNNKDFFNAAYKASVFWKRCAKRSATKLNSLKAGLGTMKTLLIDFASKSLITPEQLKLYAVTDRSWLDNTTLEQSVQEVLVGGATCLQLREKNISDEQFIDIAHLIKPICKKYNVPLIINDNIKVALSVDADGVHIGQNDISIIGARRILGIDKIIGVSAHNVEEALSAFEDGADYIGSGAVFASSTKTDVVTLSHQELSKICKSVGIPVVAIGGVNQSNVLTLKSTGISGVAVISALFASEDKRKSTKEMLELSKLL